MRKILILSDIHLRPDGQRIIGIDTFARAKAALAHAIAHHPDIDLLIILGDLAHSGRTEEYARLNSLIDGFPAPTIPMLGNHDNRENFRAEFPEAPETPDGHVQIARDLGRWRIITLDTLDGPPYRNDRHAGHLCPARLTWLDTRLSEAPERPTLIFAHHPPMAVGFPGMDNIRLKNGKALMAVLARHSQVQHLCCGHVHRTISGSYAGLGFTVMKSTAHQMPMDLAGASTIISTADPGAYGLALLNDHVTIHSEEFENAIAGVEARDVRPD